MFLTFVIFQVNISLERDKPHKMAASEIARVLNNENSEENSSFNGDFSENSDDSVKDKDFVPSDSDGLTETSEVGNFFIFVA